jgi:hypothetical protein
MGYTYNFKIWFLNDIYSERICDLAWNVSSDAQFILAVAFPRSVAIFGQKRATSVLNDNDIWVCYTEFKVDT